LQNPVAYINRRWLDGRFGRLKPRGPINHRMIYANLASGYP